MGISHYHFIVQTV